MHRPREQGPARTAGPEAATQGRPILEVRDLKTHFFTHDGIIRAVDGLDLKVSRGEIVALVGESGSGKSVTGQSIMRLLKRTPARIVEGSICFTLRDGRTVDLATAREKAMRSIRGSQIAMIFQDPMSSLNPVFTVGDQIAEIIVAHQNTNRREARAAAVDLLRQVGIPAPESRLNDYPHQLSGGMRQRVMIAIALACDPQLLIADEPTTALDVTIQAQIIALIARFRRERQMGVIFITHDLRLVDEIADRIVVMYCGQAVETGHAREVLDRPRHPYTRALLNCIPAGRTLTDLKPIPGLAASPERPPEGCRFHPRCDLMVDACRTAPVSLERVAAEHQSRCIRSGEL